MDLTIYPMSFPEPACRIFGHFPSAEDLNREKWSNGRVILDRFVPTGKRNSSETSPKIFWWNFWKLTLPTGSFGNFGKMVNTIFLRTYLVPEQNQHTYHAEWQRAWCQLEVSDPVSAGNTLQVSKSITAPWRPESVGRKLIAGCRNLLDFPTEFTAIYSWTWMLDYLTHTFIIYRWVHATSKKLFTSIFKAQPETKQRLKPSVWIRLHFGGRTYNWLNYISKVTNRKQFLNTWSRTWAHETDGYRVFSSSEWSFFLLSAGFTAY